MLLLAKKSYPSITPQHLRGCVCRQWDYKTRIQNQNELLTQLRTMLNNMLQQKQRFKDACIDTEAALKVRQELP